MPFFQNPFEQEFRGSLPFGDRQYSLTFSVPPSKNGSQAMIAWNFEPYDFSTYNTFTINFAIDKDFKNWSAISVNVAGSTASATKAAEVVQKLNADATFSAWFTAQTIDSTGSGSGIFRVGIKPKRAKTDMRAYVTNAGAEQKLGFNKFAGVAELPTYYARDTIENRFAFPDGNGMLIQLDEGDATVDQPIITAAGFDYSDMQADWELLGGRVGIFNFQKITVDGSDRITQIIEYSAGATVGALGRKTTYSYTSANKNPDKIAQVPYTLESGDLITP